MKTIFILLLFSLVILKIEAQSQIQSGNAKLIINSSGDIKISNPDRNAEGRAFVTLKDGLLAVNFSNDFKLGTNIGTQATFKDHGMILGQGRISSAADGEVDRLVITPYRHAGVWRLTPRDIGGDAFLDFNYSTFNNLLTIQHRGNIGIGTPNPQARLDVRGKIIADEVQIKVNKGADLVFQSGYNLRSLSEVKSFVEEHKHLPEIPSEKEMIEKGVNINDMQVKLLQKIEELTLYVIEQDRKYSELKRELDNLKDKK